MYVRATWIAFTGLWFDCTTLTELDFTFACVMPNNNFLQCVGDGVWAQYAVDFDRN